MITYNKHLTNLKCRADDVVAHVYPFADFFGAGYAVSQANVQPLTTSKWVNESNFFEEEDDIYEDMPEGFLDTF